MRRCAGSAASRLRRATTERHSISEVQPGCSVTGAMAVVMAYFFLGEPIRPAQVVGGLIIVLGVALTRWASMRPAAAS